MHLEDAQADLKKYYPNAVAWDAVIRQSKFGIDLSENDEGSWDISGVAVDLDRDGHADMFVMGRYGNWSQHAYMSKNMDAYLSEPACYPDNLARELSCNNFGEELSCNSAPPDFTSVAFPFSGRMLPVTSGRISAIMFASDSLTNGPIFELLGNLSDVSCQILKFKSDNNPDAPSFASMCSEYSFSPLWRRECDFYPCGGGTWVQNESVVAVNEFGDIVATATDYVRGMQIYVEPLVKNLGAVPYRAATELLDTGDVLASTTHLFVPDYDNVFLPDQNLTHMFASGLKVIKIEKYPVTSAAHLDMILTPIDETVDGKPVVIVAEAFPLLVPDEERIRLNQIAAELEQAGFYVERIPYVERRFSYNNVLLEKYRTRGKLVKRVYLPQYDAVDQKYNIRAAEVFKKYGYEMVPIKGLDNAAYHGGSLHCLVKVTSREL